MIKDHDVIIGISAIYCKHELLNSVIFLIENTCIRKVFSLKVQFVSVDSIMSMFKEIYPSITWTLYWCS